MRCVSFFFLSIFLPWFLTDADALGMDHHGPSSAGQNIGAHSLLNRPKNWVHGFSVNWDDCYFYAGDTKDFNEFMLEYSRIPTLTPILTIRFGRKKVWSPWDKKERDQFFDWMFSSSALLHTPITGVELYLGGNVKWEDLEIPANVKVNSGGELEEFISKHESIRQAKLQTQAQIQANASGWRDVAIYQRTPDSASTVFAAVHSDGPLFNSDNGHWYILTTNRLTWLEAKEEATTLNLNGLQGHLATIRSASENKWIYESLPLGTERAYWLAGRQAEGADEPRGGWHWITGEPWDYTNWAGGQPDNYPYDQSENCMEFWPRGGIWNDVRESSDKQPSIVEFE